jgi:Na+:H+ antiporter, NhaA family
MAETSTPARLGVPVDDEADHFIGERDAEITLVEYGSYSCEHCHAAHEVIADLRDRLGDRMRYVFRQLPIRGSETARPAADLAEYAAEFGDFWLVHDELMRRGPNFAPGELDEVARAFDLPFGDARDEEAWERARQKVDADRASARASGARVTPSFFINGRRYEGAWDENALAEAMLGSLGHRIHSATLDFVRWGPSAGFLLLLMSILAVAAVNSPLGERFDALWHLPFGIRVGEGGFFMPLLEWINHGLLSIFFLVVGLEIKREFTVGHLASRRAAALPAAAALGGMLVPALLYLLVIPTGPLSHGWGVPIATDTAFAIAVIVLLGDRVPVELRVFLTAAVVVDDLVAIAVVAIFYSGAISTTFVALSIAATVALFLFNRWNVYRPLPYAVVGAILWFFIHAAGLHATLAGVVIAMLTPTRPPGNLRALTAQAENILIEETRRSGEAVLRHGPSEPALRALDAIHDRIESPANKLLRNLEPWSSYVVLPIFALANAGVLLSMNVISGNERLMWAIVLGLVVGKPVGLISAAWASVKLGLAEKPASYTWRQLAGAGALAGIGFTMSLFIAGQAFSDSSAFAAAKIAVFTASLIAAGIGAILLWPRTSEEPGGSPNPEAAGTCTPAA